MATRNLADPTLMVTKIKWSKMKTCLLKPRSPEMERLLCSFQNFIRFIECIGVKEMFTSLGHR